MVSKVVILAAALVAVFTEGSHGHAVSSQSFVKHEIHHEPIHHEPIHYEPQQHGHLEHHDYSAHPKYEYAYEVKDPHTHDLKSAHEHRDGDMVKGEYSLHQPDGVVRTVKYHGDHESGFKADVHYSGPSHHVYHSHH